MIIAILSVIRTTEKAEERGGRPPGRWHRCTMHTVDIASYVPTYLHPEARTAADAQRLTERARWEQIGMYLDGKILWGAYRCDAPGGEMLDLRYEFVKDATPPHPKWHGESSVPRVQERQPHRLAA
jgi:hypothetical protein